MSGHKKTEKNTKTLVIFSCSTYSPSKYAPFSTLCPNPIGKSPVWEVVLVEGQETNCSLDTAELAVLGTGGAVLHLPANQGNLTDLQEEEPGLQLGPGAAVSTRGGSGINVLL